MSLFLKQACLFIYRDTAGNHKYAALSEMFYRGVMGAIFCYDVSDKYSFTNVEKWMEKLAKSPHSK